MPRGPHHHAFQAPIGQLYVYFDRAGQVIVIEVGVSTQSGAGQAARGVAGSADREGMGVRWRIRSARAGRARVPERRSWR